MNDNKLSLATFELPLCPKCNHRHIMTPKEECPYCNCKLQYNTKTRKYEPKLT